MDRNYWYGIWIIAFTPIFLSIIAFNLDDRPKNTTELVEKVRPGIVLIQNQIDTANGGSGTGFFVDENKIVTNHHVVDGQGQIFVTSSNSQRKYNAEIIHYDVIADIAVIRIVDWDVFKKNEMPVNLSFGNSDKTKQGDKVVVVGHPWGLTWTVSEGILSAKHRRAGQNPKFMDQVDANVFQGNSGGPIFNEDGKVICVSTMMLAMEGGSYGFCVPSNLVDKITHDLNLFNEVRWRVLNISASLTDDGSSVIVSSLEPDGAAAKAGIKEGDKLLEIQNSESDLQGIKITNPNDLITELAMLKGNNENVKLLIEREGKRMIINVNTNYRLSSDYTPDKSK
jgi:serine protease Do